MATRIARDYYKTLIIGPTGSGKTYGFRNLNALTTGFDNAEGKPLPFPHQFTSITKESKGGGIARPKNYQSVLAAFDKFAEDPTVDLIVLESISATFDMLLEECRTNFNGWDIWNAYNKSIGELVNKIKKVEKEVVITGHYEILNIEGAPEKRLKVKGKEWEGVFEKEFTIVLYSETKYKGGKPERYLYKLAGEGISAKCPPAIFGADVYDVDNDYKMVHDKIVAFATQSGTPTNQPSTQEFNAAVFA